MLEAPDKRVWYMLIPVLVVGLVFLLAPPDSPLAMAVQPLLYVLCIALGVGLGVLGLREGHSLLRPSITSSEQPTMFWLEIGVGCFLFAAIGAWNLFKVATSAG